MSSPENDIRVDIVRANNINYADVTDAMVAQYKRDRLQPATLQDMAAKGDVSMGLTGPRDRPTAAPKVHPTIRINAMQLRAALEFAAPDFEVDEDQRATEVHISYLPKRMSTDSEPIEEGLFCWLTEYPEEGGIPLLEVEEFPPVNKLSLNDIQAVAKRRIRASGDGGITDLVSFYEDAVRWAEARYTRTNPTKEGELRDALELAQNGLKWYRDAHPGDDSGADDEIMHLIELALGS